MRYVFWTAFKRLLMTFGAIFLLGVIMGSILSAGVGTGAPRALPGKFALYLPLDGGFPEHEDVAVPYGLGPPMMTLRHVVDALDLAAGDKRVTGIVVDLKSLEMNVAQLQELRAALLRFRASGKPAYIYAASYGEMGRGLGSYYLASAFDEIWMQPMGEVSIAGISVEMPFFRGALEKIGVEPQFFTRKEYKNVFESASAREMSPQSRRMMEGLVNDIAEDMVSGIAQGREMEPSGIRALVDRGLFMDAAAADAGLVDYIDDFEVLQEKESQSATGKPDGEFDDIFVDVEEYVYSAVHKAAVPAGAKKRRVALVYIVGTIVQSGYGDGMVAADDIAADIVDAANDEDIKSVVIRIDSPGGSPVASETIRRAILRAKTKGKKVIVSMGGAAASGGYWIAAPADRIFALPGTLTGSIGVAGGKVSLAGLWGKVGINWESVDYGANANMFSFNNPFDESGTAAMNGMMDAIYDGFISRVAEGRGMTKEKAERIARGHVWTGKQAVANGLVDEIGGLDAALDYAAKELGATDRRDLRIVVLPRPLSVFEKMADLIGKTVHMGRGIGTLAQRYSLVRQSDALTVWQPLTIR
ncbi:MAG: signal peptide peptidase SppA [Proteobacteria bacterium]|nr:signal peptide peptidase SppA [Pseudomonadota bacterium]